MPAPPAESGDNTLSGLVTRFAPSPTGRLHAGHAFSALTAYDWAIRSHGRFLLRIEDIDGVRCTPTFEAEILEDLTWLGIRWETPVRRQSEHLETYRSALRVLEARGLVYRCFRTRREILNDIGRAPHDRGDVVRGGALAPSLEAERLARGDAYAWRLSLSAAERDLGVAYGALEIREIEDPPIQGASAPVRRRPADPGQLGDIVLARKDLGVSYHLACVLDDALQEVTHVVRGDDLRTAADSHRLLQALLRLPTPIYHHHPLILDPDGRRLAKRAASRTLRAYRAAGFTVDALRSEILLSQGQAREL